MVIDLIEIIVLGIHSYVATLLSYYVVEVHLFLQVQT